MESKGLLSFREFEGKKTTILTIPKGTILFRHVYKTDSPIYDFLGKYNEKEDKYTLSPDQYIYFYFYPYIRDTNKFVSSEIQDISTMITYVTSRDVNILLLIYPSKYSKSKRFRSNAIALCDEKIDCSGQKGFETDICFKNKFREENPDILGNISIKYSDNVDLKEAIQSGKFNDFKKFITFFKNVNNNSGVPELALYPRTKNTDKCIETKLDVSGYDWITKHFEEFNYFPLLVQPHKLYEKDDFYKFLIQGFNPEGYIDPETSKVVYHLTIDKRTYFYMLKEVIEKKTYDHCLDIHIKNKLKILKEKNSELIFKHSYMNS
jgi:hypothetical protein